MASEIPENVAPAKLTGDALLKAVQSQVEFYFSRENLSQDSYLVSQMNSQMFVPIATILQFSKVKSLTDSSDIVVKALHGSTACVLSSDNTAVRPNIKSERNTIILREISSETLESDVRAIFDDTSKVKNIRSDVGDTWFVTMESEKDAVAALLSFGSKKINGSPIKARLKSETLVRSFYPTVTVDGAVPPTAFGGKKASSVSSSNVTYYKGSNFFTGRGPSLYGNNVMAAAQTPAGGSNRYGGGRMSNRPKSSRYQQQPNNYGASATAQSTSSAAGSSASSKESSKKGSRKVKDKKSASPASGSLSSASPAKKNEKPHRTKDRQPVLNVANFPPLPTPTAGDKDASGAASSGSVAADRISRIYTHDDLMEIVRNMSDEDCELKSELDFETFALALTEKAHPELLRNQRTFSIEQAREAMRQGRPLRSDSVGSVDYDSMMYGEELTKVIREEKSNLAPENTPAVAGQSTKDREPQQEPQPKKGGYAAALINGATAAPPALSTATPRTGSQATSKTPKKPSTTSMKKDAEKKEKVQDKEVKKATTQIQDKTSKKLTASSASTAPAWGGKRSFVDVLTRSGSQEETEVSKSVDPTVSSSPEAPASSASK